MIETTNSSPGTVKGALVKAYRYSFRRFFRLLYWALPGLLLSIGLVIALTIYADGIITEKAADAVIKFLNLFILSPILIAVHRDVISRENFEVNYFATFLKSYYFKFICLLFMLVFSAAIPIVVGVFLLSYAGIQNVENSLFVILLLTILFIYLWARVSVSMPLKAAGQSGWMLRAWKMTSGNGLLISVSWFAANILPSICLGIINNLPSSAYSNWALTTIAIGAEQFAAFLYLIINASFLSFVYVSVNVKQDDITVGS